MAPDATPPQRPARRSLLALTLAAFACLGMPAAVAQDAVCLAYRAQLDEFARSGIDPQAGLATVVEVLERRLSDLGARASTVARLGDDLVVVRLAPTQSVDELRESLARPGELAIHRVERTFPTSDLAVMLIGPDRMAYPSAERTEFSYLVHRPAILEGAVIADARVGRDNIVGEPVVSIRLSEDARAAFATATKAAVGAQLAVVLDGVVLTAPTVRDTIADGRVQISGGFTPESANELALLLRSGALPARLVLEGEGTGACIP